MGAPQVLVLGGGLTGLHAAAALAAAGVSSLVVEQAPVVGGRRAAWLAGDGEQAPELAGVFEDERVELLTQARLVSLEGGPGEFRAVVETAPRYVTADCTRCNHCVPACPQVLPNEYDAGLTYRKAIHSPLPGGWPPPFAIDIEACLNVPPNYLPCQRCVAVCDDQAIRFDMEPVTVARDVAAVIVATGFATDTPEEKAVLAEFGYGEHPDVVSSAELQRLLEDPGPSGGFAIRPSDEAYPRRALMVLTRTTPGACWILGNQCQRLVDQDVAVSILVLGPPDPESLAELPQRAQQLGAELDWGHWIGLDVQGEELVVSYARLPGGGRGEHRGHLVVLSGDIYPPPSLAALPELALDERGFPREGVEGILPLGGATGLVGVEPAVEQVQTAVAKLLAQLPAEAIEQPAGDGWAGLSEDEQRAWLEQLLQRLMALGEQARS